MLNRWYILRLESILSSGVRPNLLKTPVNRQMNWKWLALFKRLHCYMKCTETLTLRGKSCPFVRVFICSVQYCFCAKRGHWLGEFGSEPRLKKPFHAFVIYLFCLHNAPHSLSLQTLFVSPGSFDAGLWLYQRISRRRMQQGQCFLMEAFGAGASDEDVPARFLGLSHPFGRLLSERISAEPIEAKASAEERSGAVSTMANQCGQFTELEIVQRSPSWMLQEMNHL